MANDLYLCVMPIYITQYVQFEESLGVSGINVSQMFCLVESQSFKTTFIEFCDEFLSKYFFYLAIILYAWAARQ